MKRSSSLRRSSACGVSVRLGEVRQPAVAADAERLVARAEVAGAGVAGRAHADEARQVGVGIAVVLGDHRADLGVRHALGLLVAGVHVVDAVGMVRRLRAHAADDRELVDLPRHLRQVLADLHAGDVGLDRPERPAGRPAGLHVEGVDLAGPAVHPQQDAALALACGLLGDGLRVEQPAPVGDGQAAGGGERRLQEGAAAGMKLQVTSGRLQVGAHLIPLSTFCFEIVH